MINLKNLSKTYKTSQGELKALDGLSLKMESGQIYGVIGLSGAGKSTLIRCINLLEEPSSGQIIVNGVTVNDLKGKALNSFRKNIGMIFQNFNLMSSRNVWDNVALSLELKGVKKKERQVKVLEILKRVGLEDKENEPVSQLSGGQKQRVAIARALVTSPKILLCDEATSALDPRTTQEILALIKSLRDELNLTVVWITHEMSVVSEICDRVALIEKGKIIKEGTVEEVLNNCHLLDPMEKVV
jgi:D-methionine transport system ATP-binding protein